VICKSWCRHGGRCVLETGHTGLHDSRYCTWADTESLTRQQADAVLRQNPEGAAFLEYLQPLADLLEQQMEDEP
jgi:uncharacterized Fe-S cluster protein YjdI